MAPLKPSLKRPQRDIFKGLHTETHNTRKKKEMFLIFFWLIWIQIGKQGILELVCSVVQRERVVKTKLFSSQSSYLKLWGTCHSFIPGPGYGQGQQRAPTVHWRCLRFARSHKYGHIVRTHIHTGVSVKSGLLFQLVCGFVMTTWCTINNTHMRVAICFACHTFSGNFQCVCQIGYIIPSGLVVHGTGCFSATATTALL